MPYPPTFSLEVFLTLVVHLTISHFLFYYISPTRCHPEISKRHEPALWFLCVISARSRYCSSDEIYISYVETPKKEINHTVLFQTSQILVIFVTYVVVLYSLV